MQTSATTSQRATASRTRFAACARTTPTSTYSTRCQSPETSSGRTSTTTSSAITPSATREGTGATTRSALCLLAVRRSVDFADAGWMSRGVIIFVFCRKLPSRRQALVRQVKQDLRPSHLCWLAAVRQSITDCRFSCLVCLVPSIIQVHDNIGYGFDPHDDSDYVTINNNHVHHNGWHGISEFEGD